MSTHRIPLSVTDVKELRDKTGLGMQICKRILIGREMRVMLANATTIDELKVLMAEIIDTTHPDLEGY